MTALTPALAMSEAELFENVRDAVKKLDPGGYLYHTHDSRRSAAGFPDLAICLPRYRRALFRELKTERGRLSPAQRACIDAMRLCLVDVDVWRPSDWSSGRIIRELTGRCDQQEAS